MTQDLKENYQAYADGINHYIQEAVLEKKLPEKFKEAGIVEPKPWKVTDTMAIGIMMENRFGSSGGAELSNAAILQKLKDKFGPQAKEVFDDLIWRNDRKTVATIPGSEKSAASAQSNLSAAAGLAKLSDETVSQLTRLAQQSDVCEYASRNNLPTGWGSVCWAISPRLSASGNAVILGSPAMGYSTPSIVHEIHYSAGPLNAIGMGFPGIPGVILGHNDSIAWSMTSGVSDLKDIFIEKLNPSNKTQYLHNGSYRDMEKRVEVIRIKGEPARQVEVYRTVYGPVIGWDAQSAEQATSAYSLATSFRGSEFKTFQAIYGFNFAKNIKEFAKLTELICTNHNFIVATTGGDIGYWHCGKFPIRSAGYDSRLPVSGTGENDWQGFLPVSKTPHVINPAQGFIINWNSKPADWWENGDRPIWGEIQSIHALGDFIRSHAPMTFEQVRDLTQYAATIDEAAEYLKPYLLKSLNKTGAATSDARIAQVATYLRAWDNIIVDGSVGKTIFDAWIDAAREAIFQDEFGFLKMVSLPKYNELVSPNLLLHVLEGPSSGAPPSRDYFNGKSKDAVIVEALSKALDQLQAARGPQMNLWCFKQAWINFNPLPGIPATNRGSYIHTVELSGPNVRAFSILPPGQSENPLSPHYADQREMAGYWRQKEMLYKRDQLEQALASQK